MSQSRKVTIKVSDEELELLKKFREGVAAVQATPQPVDQNASSIKAMADAFVEAIERTKPPAKITVANRKARTPWSPAPGEAAVKLKRKFFHHALAIDPEKVTNQEKELLNQIKPGRYCEGWVTVTLRKDRGLDIDYPVRTNVQRLRLINQHGIRSFTELLSRIIDEKAYPAKYRKPEDKDLYDIDNE